MTMTHQERSTTGRHAGAPAEVDHEADLVVERLAEVGIPAGLPAALGDNQGTTVRGAHAVDAAGSFLPWRLLLTGVLAVLVVLALAFVALDAVVPLWTGASGGPA